MRLRRGQLGAQLYTGNGAEASLSDGGVGRGQGIISVVGLMVDPAVDHTCGENSSAKPPPRVVLPELHKGFWGGLGGAQLNCVLF